MSEDPTDDVPSWLAPRVSRPPMSPRTLVVAWLSVTWGVVLCLEWIARTGFDEPGLGLLSDRFTSGIGAAGVVSCAAAACLAARKQWAPWVPLVGAPVYVFWLIEGVSEHTAGTVVLIVSASVLPLVARTLSFVLLVEDLHERMDKLEQRRRSKESPAGLMDRPSLAPRLTALGASVADRLTIDQKSWLSEFIGAGEYGTALEMIADWLSEATASVLPEERAEAEALSTVMGIHDRVMGPLALCPG